MRCLAWRNLEKAFIFITTRLPPFSGGREAAVVYLASLVGEGTKGVLLCRLVLGRQAVVWGILRTRSIYPCRRHFVHYSGEQNQNGSIVFFCCRLDSNSRKDGAKQGSSGGLKNRVFSWDGYRFFVRSYRRNENTVCLASERLSKIKK